MAKTIKLNCQNPHPALGAPRLPPAIGRPLPQAGEASTPAPTSVGEGWGEGLNLFSSLRVLVLSATLALAACAPKGEALYARAEASLTKGNVSAAVIDLKNLVEAEPTNAKARALLGTALIASGDWGSGEIEIQKAKDLGAPKELTLAASCKLLVAKGQYSEALAVCDPDKAPANAKVDLQISRGGALVGLKRAPEAMPLLEAAVAAKPDSIDALLALADAAYQTGGSKAAQAVFDKAPASVKDRPRYWLAIGGLSAASNDLPAAEKAYKTALDKTPKASENVERLSALGGLAEVQMRQGKISEANATSQELIKAAPNNLLAKQLRGQIAAAGGKLDEARSLLEEVVSAQPDNFNARTLLGLVNLQQGNFGQAEMHFANVVARNPDDARAQRLLAEVRAKSQTPADALASMKPALEQTGNDPGMLAMAGRLSLASGNREQGLEYLAQASDPNAPKTPDVQLEVASSYISAGDFDRAIEVLKAMPKDGAAAYQREYMLLMAMLRKGDKDAAVAEAKELLVRSGNDPAIRNLVAGVYSAVGQLDMSHKQLEEALKLKPDDLNTMINIARLDLLQGKPDDAERDFKRVLDKDPKNLMATSGLAATALMRKNVKDAEKWLQKAAADHPDSSDAQIALANFYVGQRDSGKAKASIDAAAKANPKDPAIANASGLVLIASGDIPAAIASFGDAVRLAPKSYGYALNLARAHAVNKDLKSTLDVVNNVLKDQPKQPDALALGAISCMQFGDLEKASGYVARFREALPNSPVGMQLEGDLAMAQKRYKDALQAYAKADPSGSNGKIVVARFRAGILAKEPQPEKVLIDWVAAHPTDAEGVAMLGEYYRASGKVSAAANAYEAALSKAPGNALLLNNLAVIYQVQGDPKAVATAEKAYNAAPKAPEVQDTYAWILVGAGQVDKGLELLQDAAKKLPNNAEVQYHLAAALAKSGKKSEALPVLKKALTGQMPAAAKADAQKLLADLSE